jgi:hemolysin activation/secretion protein
MARAITLMCFVWMRGYTTRHRHRTARRLYALTALCLLVASVIEPHRLYAQARPDAGQALQNLRPPPAAAGSNPGAALPPEDTRPAMDGPDAQSILVRHWRITGAHIFPVAKLEVLIHEYHGQKLTIRELNAAAGRITAYYRQHGYLLSRAYVPAQKIRDYTVEIAVIEGHLASIEVTNTSPVTGALITKHLAHLRSPRPVEGQAIERSLLLLSDLPGIEVRSTLKPGAAVGTSDLDVQVHGASRLDGSVDADSFGNRYTGQYRGGGTLNFNDPFHHGDLFTMRADTAGPGMTYGRAAWQTPLGGNGLKTGIAASELHYRLGKNFESLHAHGNAQVGTLWAAYPVFRSQYYNLAVQLSYDHKRLDDRVDSTTTDSHKTLGVLTLGLSGDRSDGLGRGGLSAFSLDLISGQLSLDPLTAALDRGAGGHHTHGRYYKLAYSYSRTQRLDNEFVLYAALSGQVSNKNLDTSETQSLGGVYGVRAYPQDEAIGNDAAALNLELRYPLSDIPEIQTIGFFDVGAVRVNHSPLPTDTDNRRTLAGGGFGAQWMRTKHFALKTYLAWRLGPQPLSDSDRRPRFWLQFAQYF